MKAILIQNCEPSYNGKKFSSGDEVEVIDGTQTDGDGFYNYQCGMCYLCRDNSG